MAILNKISERIEAKKGDYSRYNFTQRENDALKTFFDLAQEFDKIEEFYNLCVAIPKKFFGLDARLYLIDPGRNSLILTETSEDSGYRLRTSPAKGIHPSDRPYYTGDKSLVLTIRGKGMLTDGLPFYFEEDVLGILEVFLAENLDPHVELFFEKFANRIGFRLHNKFLVIKNIEHLKFIKSLVADIEHNVIVPNMVYKLFLKNLKAKIIKNKELEKLFNEYLSGIKHDDTAEDLLKELNEVNQELAGELDNIERHHKNMTLFIETLFRKSHFDQGRLILRTKSCNMKREVVEPQLERFVDPLSRAGITIDDRLSGIPDEETINVVDIGLVAQVYANLFSNALKYTRDVEILGIKKKYIAYGHHIAKDFFGPGKDGAKYNVFSSGPHIPEEEREKIFEEEYRGSNAEDKAGTGHGLAFVKNVIEIHGGVIGYEAVDYGNNFYFVLPVKGS
jgi:signal transduction histidine kinase